MTPPTTPRLLAPEWMRAYLIRFCRPRSLTWACPRPGESHEGYLRRVVSEGRLADGHWSKSARELFASLSEGVRR